MSDYWTPMPPDVAVDAAADLGRRYAEYVRANPPRDGVIR